MQEGNFSKFTVVVAVLMVSAAATIPYLSTVHGYFLGEDFGLVQLFSNRPILHFLHLFIRPYDENIWGDPTDELRAFAALYYTLGTLGGANSPDLQHIITITFHVLTSLLVLVTARSVACISWIASVFAAVLFAVLPIHAETVSWITGRVDSSMALFYTASFLAYAHWRRTRMIAILMLSVAAYFVALYNKESAITLPATLFLYDRLIARRNVRLSWGELQPYLPYALLTGAMLTLRYVLFDNFVHANGLFTFGIVWRYLPMQVRLVEELLFGSVFVTLASPLSVLIPSLVIGLCIGVFVAIKTIRLLQRPTTQSIRNCQLYVLFFGPGWWLICTAPLLVAGPSLRYLYLPAIGIAIALGLVFDMLQRMQYQYWRYFTMAGAAALVMLTLWGLRFRVQEWNIAAMVSDKVQSALEREAVAAPEGVLLIVDAPDFGGTSKRPTRLWASAIPFTVQPPFMKSDLSNRLIVVCPFLIYATLPNLWFEDMQRLLWRADERRLPIVVMRWDSRSGDLTRRTNVDMSDLPSRVLELANAKSPKAMTERMNALLNAIPQR